MDTVTVNKVELLEILRANRDAHRAIFEEAVAGYKDQILNILNAHIRDIKSGKVKTVQVILPEPVDQTKEYDKAIKKAEMSVEDVIELDDREFTAYVMDDWNWKRQFLTSNAQYSATATSML